MNSIKLHYWVLLLLPLNLFGQAENSIVKEPILNLEEVIPVPNKGFILFKTDSVEAPTVLNFTYFNLDNESVGSVSIPTSRTNELFALEKLFIWNNKLIICSSLYQPGFRKNHLLYYEYNLPDLTLSKSEILLKTVAPPNVYVPYFISLSPDSTKLVAVGWHYHSPTVSAKISAKVFDKNLSLEKQQEYEFTFPNERLAIEEILIDNNRKIYVSGNNYRGNLKAPTNLAKIDHFVVGLFPKEKDKLWLIKKNKHHFTQIKLSLTKEQKLIGTSYWSKSLKSGIGFIEFVNDKTTNIIIHPIAFKDFKAAYKKNLPTFAPSRNGFFGYELTHFICKKDAYFTILENQYFDGQYDDIVVIKLTVDGALNWLSRIPKVQNTLGVAEKLASFSILERPDKLYFLFNDSYLNYRNGNGFQLNAANVLDAKPALAELSLSTGQIERKKLPKLLSKDYLFLPTFCQPTTEEDIIIVGTGVLSKAGKFLLKKVTIKKKDLE